MCAERSNQTSSFDGAPSLNLALIAAAACAVRHPERSSLSFAPIVAWAAFGAEALRRIRSLNPGHAAQNRRFALAVAPVR
jgi:tryptophan-rich sensory protein